MGPILFLAGLLGCYLGTAIGTDAQDQAAHITPFSPRFSLGIQAEKGLLIRYTSFGREDLESQWEVYEDGRVRLREEDRGAWTDRKPLSPASLELLKSRMRAMDLGSAKGHHSQANRADDIGTLVIYAPFLGSGVALEAPEQHDCVTLKRFREEIFDLITTAPIEAQPVP